MRSVPFSPVTRNPSTADWTTTYLPALVGRTDTVLLAVDELCARPYAERSMGELVWATRALWVINQAHRAESLLSECLLRGGIRAAELGTFAHARHGVGYAWVRLALAPALPVAADARCDLAILALRQGDTARALNHIKEARSLDSNHTESARWHSLLELHGPCLLRWLEREAPVSAEVACRLLDLWPDISNGYLSPARFRTLRKRTPPSW